MLGERLASFGNIAIYGAGVIAFNIAEALQTLYHIRPVAYFVTKKEIHHRYFSGIIPKEFSKESWELCGKPVILVAVPVVYHREIYGILKREEVTESIFLDSDMQYQLMSTYFVREKKFLLIGADKNLSKNIENINDCFAVYMAVSRHDRPLSCPVDFPPWIVPVHAGSVGEEHLLAEQKDDFPGGISARNGNYSELSVTYWVWKQSKSLYKGICHYRRWLQLSDENIRWLQNQDIDVILPLPYLCSPDTSEQYKRYISTEDFETLLDAVQVVCPEKKEEMDNVLQGDYLYNHNLVIAKREIFDCYCEFVFSILFEVERQMQEKGRVRNDRYLGYLGEILTSVYFDMNQKILKIAHAPVRWVV